MHLAMVGYTAEYAFGRRGRIASTSGAATGAPATAAVSSRAPAKVLVATDGSDVAEVSDFSQVAGVDGVAGSDAAVPAGPAAGSAAGAGSPPVILATATKRGRDQWGNRLGRLAVVVTIIGALFHLTSIAIRGAAVDSVPWSNMYEFASVVGFIAVVAFLVVMFRAPQIRYLGLFVMMPVVLVMFLAGTVLYSQASPLVPALQSYWWRSM